MKKQNLNSIKRDMLRREKLKRMSLEEAIYQLRKIEESYGLERYHFVDMLEPKHIVKDLIVAGKF